MKRRPPMWPMCEPGVKRQPYLDPDGYHCLVAVGPDHREVHRVRVFSPEDELEAAAMLRRMLAERFGGLKDGAS